MSETKVEKVINRIKSLICDWGLEKPTVPKNGVFYGNTAPIWRCPSPVLLLGSGILHLLIFISELIAAAYLLKLDGSCKSDLTTARNLLIFFFLINGGFQFYMSRSDTGTDKQWCRYITISTFAESIQLLLVLVVGFMSIGCNDNHTYNIAVSCAILGIISTGVFIGVIIYTILKLYCLGNPLAYNQELN